MAAIKYKNPNYTPDGLEPEWIKLPLVGLAKVTPVLTTGNSETEIMSQKAVTDELNNKSDIDHLHKLASDSEDGFMSSTDKSILDSYYSFYEGVNTSTSISNVPVTKRLCIVTVNANGSFSLASTPPAGREVHIIVKNSSSSDITITMPTSSGYVNMSGDSLTVAGSSYADINVLSDGTNMYIRFL